MSNKEYKDFLEFKSKYSSCQYLSFGQAAAALTVSMGNISKAAEMLGITSSRFRKFVKDNPELEQVIVHTTEDISDIATSNIVEKVQEKDFQASKLWLQSQAKERGWSNRTEVTGKDGKDLYTGATEEDKEAIMNEFLRGQKSVKDSSSNEKTVH